MKRIVLLWLILVVLVSAVWGQRGRYQSSKISFRNFTDATAPAQLGSTGQRRYRNVSWKEAELFDDVSQWGSNTNSTDTANTTEFVTSANTTPQSIKLTMAGGGTEGNATKTSVGWGDVTNSHIYFRFYVHDGTGTANPDQITNISIRLADTSVTNWITRNLFTWNPLTDYAGWHEQTLALDLLSVSGAGARATLLAGIDNLKIIVKTASDADSTVSVTFDLIAIISALTQPKYMFTFDDGQNTDFKYAAYLHSQGLRGTFYVQGGRIGTGSYLTMDQLHRMQDMGHLIANHGWVGFDYQTDSTTDDQLRIELTRTTELLCANGFSAGARLFALPNGSPTQTEALWDKHYKYWDSMRVTETAEIAVPGVWATGLVSVDSNNDTTEAATALTNAIAGNTIAVSLWHTLQDPGEFTFANWKTHVAAVLAEQQAGTIDVITMDEWVYETPPGPREVITVGVETYNAYKTVIRTISIDDDASTDDFQFDDDAVNANEQTVDMGALIPAFAEIVSAQVRCIEAVVSSEADPDDIAGLDLGVSDGGGEILATGTPDDLNDILSTVAADSPEIIATNAARNVWINLNPADNWSTMSAGRWAVIVTYLDYGAVHDVKNP